MKKFPLTKKTYKNRYSLKKKDILIAILKTKSTCDEIKQNKKEHRVNMTIP